MSSPVKILFSGHRGCGKTTELEFLSKTLQSEGFLVVFVTAIKDMNIQDLYYTDLLLMLVKKTIELISTQVKLDKRHKKKIEDNLRQLSRDLVKEDIIELKSRFGLKAFSDWVDLFFTRDRTTRQTVRVKADSLITEIIGIFNSIVKSIQDTTSKRIVVIVDDVEKVADEEKIVDIFIKHSNIVIGLECHIVMTVPPSLFYSPSFRQLGQTYGITFFLPPFQVRNRDGLDNREQIQLMESIIRKRISDKIIRSELLQTLARQSGGLLFDFIRMTKLSLNNTSLHDQEYVTSEYIEEAFNDLVNEYDKIISPQYYDLLKNVHQNKDAVKDKVFRDLLFQLILLEYIESGRSWYDLHPAVEQLLLNKGIIRFTIPK